MFDWDVLDEVYGKLGGLYDKVAKLKETEKEEEGKKPGWMESPRKKSSPLKHIDAEESALPLSIIPHGVPMTRGFSESSTRGGLLVIPTSSSPGPTPRPLKPGFSQFLSFGPVTPTTLSTVPTSTSEAFSEKLNTLKKTSSEVSSAPVSGFSEEETVELIQEEEKETKMTADMINAEIEAALDIKMPNYTELLYGDNEGQRFERDSNFSNDEVRNINRFLA